MERRTADECSPIANALFALFVLGVTVATVGRFCCRAVQRLDGGEPVLTVSPIDRSI